MQSVMNKKFNQLHLDGDEASKDNEVKIINFIKNNNLVYAQSPYPGSGKSHRFVLAFDKEKEYTLFISPTNKLCVKYKKLGFNTKTLCSFLCQDKNGMKRKMTKEEYELYAKLKYLVVDEIYCMSINDIQAIEYWRREHPLIKVYCTGDRNQLEPINPTLTAKEIKYESDFLEKNIMKLFPNTIIYNQIQRCRKEDGSIDMDAVNLIKQLKEEIFAEPLTEKRVRYILRHFRSVKFSDIKTKNNICYLNATARKLNARLNTIYGGIKEGSVFICKKRLDTKDLTTYVNYEYIVSKILEDGYELFEELEEKYFKITNKEYANHFMLNYTLTNHSLQGCTYSSSAGDITLLDVLQKNRFGHLLINQNFLWVALTRCEKLSNLQVCFDGEFNVKGLADKIEGHRQTDIAKGVYNEKKFITENWFYTQLNTQQYKCACCKIDLLFEYEDRDGAQYSINRLYNKDDDGKDTPHNCDSCNIVCWTCNARDTFPWREANKEVLEGML